MNVTVKKVNSLTVKNVKELFKPIGGNHINIFQKKDWDILYIENRPFIDEDTYPFFFNFFSKIKENEINIIPYPTNLEGSYLVIKTTSNFDDFDDLMNQYYFRFVGGVSYGESKDWALYSEPDNHILFFGFHNKYIDIVKEIFKKNIFIVDKIRLIEYYDYKEGDNT
jgi:hypothetical protein